MCATRPTPPPEFHHADWRQSCMNVPAQMIATPWSLTLDPATIVTSDGSGLCREWFDDDEQHRPVVWIADSLRTAGASRCDLAIGRLGRDGRGVGREASLRNPPPA